MNNKYKYAYENDNKYCYPGTDILKNTLNITDEKILYDAEREIVAYKMTSLVQDPLKGNFDFNHLKAIHGRLFINLYDWAGTPRTCAIAKNNLFCLPQFIDTFAEEIFSKLEMENYYINYDYDTTIDCLVNLFSDINALHPFREGNGRTQREFIEELAKINGIDLDLTRISSLDNIKASHESINGDTRRLKRHFVKCAKKLTKEEQLHYLDVYVLSNTLLNRLKNDVLMMEEE